MKLIAKFQELSTARKNVFLAIVLPLLVLVVGPLTTALGLPLIGYAVSLNSIKSGRRSKDNLVYTLFAVLSVIALALLLILRTPPFVTDWEGGNPLDHVIMLMSLAWMLALATVWGLVGWVGHRVVANARDRKNRGAAAADL